MRFHYVDTYNLVKIIAKIRKTPKIIDEVCNKTVRQFLRPSKSCFAQQAAEAIQCLSFLLLVGG